MRTTRRRIPAGTMAPDIPIMMVQRSPNMRFQTSKARPSCLPGNAVPCMRVRISDGAACAYRIERARGRGKQARFSLRVDSFVLQRRFG